MAKADLARTGSTIRCAIYTRKSSDEGLEQEFNSLDAQREACEAYIVSQRHAGWVALATCTTTAACPAGRWSGRPSSCFWRTSRPTRFKSLLSTRSTD
jgi:hypothetical protein